MALSAELEALVNTITDEGKREATRKQLIENQENGLRQEEFSRKMNQAAAEEKRYQELYNKNIQWFEENNAEVQRLRAVEATAKDQVAELERIKTATRGDLTDTEEDQLAKELKEAKSRADQATKELTSLKTQISTINEKIAKGEYLTQADFEKKVEEAGNRLGNAMFRVLDKEREHEKLYGKPIDRNLLIAESNKRGGDIEGAFEALTKTDREALLRKNIEAEYQKKYEDRLRSLNMPTDTGSGTPFEGPLQTRLKQGDGTVKDSTIDPNIPADATGRLSAAIGAELRAEGKF